MILGIDTGGTFTDFVHFDGRSLRTHKVLSTPEAPEQAIIQGVKELGLDQPGLYIVHGSTVATNAVLQGKGVRTVFITNHGLRDMLTIARQTRRSLYDLQPQSPSPPVPSELCLETGGRLGAGGEVVEALTEDDKARLRAEVERLAPQAVAINLLFSFMDDRFEREIEQALPEGPFVSRSSYVLPEYKEYERGVVTWLNARVGPLVQRYLDRMRGGLATNRISVMQSSGGTIAAEQAGSQAVHMLLSGPAGGLAGARFVAGAAGHDRLLSIDMGGTSTDVAMIDGELQLTSEGRIGDYPVAVPMVDMHTIGAGGGSLARVDSGGLLRVGPESAGAEPGPACYGRGGTEPTVTDANLVLGRLLAEAFLGGEMTLDRRAAEAAVIGLGCALGLSTMDTAAGIVRIANEHMAQALRVISVQRGHDPRDFTLVSFGGAGGLHVCALADLLSIGQAVVPVHAGVLSALGMLVAPCARELSRSIAGLLGEAGEQEIENDFAALIERGRQALLAEGIADEDIVVGRTLDLRYQGQSYSLNVPWQGVTQSEHAFHETHEVRYGHRLALPVEVVNVRASLRGPRPAIELQRSAPAAQSAPYRHVRMHGIKGEVPVHARAALAADQRLDGPALVTETVSTTYIAPGWRCRNDGYGNLILKRKEQR